MKEQRQQAYLHLIQTLLNSPNGEEAQILEANQDLVDAEFLQVVEAVAKMMSEESNENTANWLRDLGNQLAEVLNLKAIEKGKSTEEDLQAYFQFLIEVLQATEESNGDTDVVYPVLTANTDKLDITFAQVLRHWAKGTFETAEADVAKSIALTIANFGSLIQDLVNFAYLLENKAINIEITLACYESSLIVLTRGALPLDWARVQSNLGHTYRIRILGDKAKNIENAIFHYQAALQVRTCQASPVHWVLIQNSLGNAYGDRILGDQAENIENAIFHYRTALQVETRKTLPQCWAITQNSLGAAYTKRILGDRAENIENAINSYQSVLRILTRRSFPEEWAMAKNSLGVAYTKRILGDRAENIENAITLYKTALEVHTREILPEYWAMTQNHLGIAYTKRILGDRAENIENAIAYFQAALEVRTRQALPLDWAITQMNLGNAYSNRIFGDQAENTENAISCYEAALQVYTRQAFPKNHAEILSNLGVVYQYSGRFNYAYTTYKFVIAIVESLRGEIISGEESKRKQAEEWTQLYRLMVEVCLELGEDIQAIEYVERSKTRNLVELILERDSKTIFPPEVVIQLEKLRDEIAKGQYNIQNGTAENPTALAQHLQELRQQKNHLQDIYLPVAYGFNFDKFQATLEKNTVIVEWYITREGWETFVISRDQLQRFNSFITNDDLEALSNSIDEYLKAYYSNKTEWISSIASHLTQLSEILHIEDILKLIPENCSRLIIIPHLALHLLPLHALPIGGGDLLCDRFPDGVSYAPSLQILQQVQKRDRPNFQNLFAIQNPTGDLNYTNLEVQVIQSYFNNANILKKSAATLTAINNSDLNAYHCVHFSCHGYFNLENPGKSALLLANSAITETPTNLDSQRYLNLRGGETYDLEKCLTLDKIFTLKLEKCRLVTLSACETGLIDFNNVSDEYIGLPSGFLLAGSPSVVSSLWTVDDLSTSFLMIKFYENLIKLNAIEAGNIAIAINQAQQWLRNLNIQELNKFLEQHQPQIEKTLAQLRVGQRLRFQESLKLIRQRQHLPFANPYYWAGFTVSGL